MSEHCHHHWHRVSTRRTSFHADHTDQCCHCGELRTERVLYRAIAWGEDEGQCGQHKPKITPQWGKAP